MCYIVYLFLTETITKEIKLDKEQIKRIFVISTEVIFSVDRKKP
jgi:hypothetical protein